MLLLGHVSKTVGILLSKLRDFPDMLLCYCNYHLNSAGFKFCNSVNKSISPNVQAYICGTQPKVHTANFTASATVIKPEARTTSLLIKAMATLLIDLGTGYTVKFRRGLWF